MYKEELNKRNIYITTNVTCNLNCIYCYEDKSSTEIFDVQLIKRKLIDHLSIKSGGGTIINLHGGEPFIVFKEIRQLSEWLWNQNFPESFLIFATSNGTLIHGEIKEWLETNKERFIVGLSLDGNKEMHDLNRSGSFDSIDIDFFAKTWPFQGVKMTVSPLTLNKLSDGIIYLHNRGLHRILVNLAYLVDWSDTEYKAIYQRELRKLAEFYKANPDLPKDSIFDLKLLNLSEDRTFDKKWCGAGTKMKAYDLDGSEFPCHLFFKSVCGKEKSIKSKDIDFNNSKEYISKECEGCVFLAACPTCYGANYIERNNIGSRDMSLCDLNKIRIYEVAKAEYNKIINDNTNCCDLSDHEKIIRIRTLDAIERIIPHFSI